MKCCLFDLTKCKIKEWMSNLSKKRKEWMTKKLRMIYVYIYIYIYSKLID